MSAAAGAQGATPTRRALLTGAAAVAGFGLGAASGPARAQQDAPRRGGTLRLGLGGGSTDDSFDPRRWTDSVMIDAGFAVFNNLVENGADNRPVPELATAWEPRDGARTWILTLRRGVTFHNGKSFGADDAVYSLNLHRAATPSGAAGVLKGVTGIRKHDAETIEITLSEPDAEFPVVLTDYHLKMVPDGFTDWAQPVGTGAFTLERFRPGVDIALVSTGSYWKPDRGFLDRIEIRVLGDTTARMNALILGEVDAINRADPRTVSRIEKSPTLEIVRASGGWFPVMAMMVDRDPYTNLDLRLALKHALDREQVIKALFSGYGALGNDHPIPRSDPDYNPDIAQLVYDPDRARYHFKRAGITDPKIVLRTSDAAFNGALDLAKAFAATAGHCDIPVTVKPEPADGYFNTVWLKEPFVTSYWGGRPTATQMLDVAYQSQAPWNESHWRDPAFDALLARAKAETDEFKRRRLVWDMQAMLTAASGTLIPCFRDWLDAHDRKVGGHTPHSGFDMDNGRIAEKAWIRSAL